MSEYERMNIDEVRKQLKTLAGMSNDETFAHKKNEIKVAMQKLAFRLQELQQNKEMICF